MSAALLSQFDLVFILLDRPDELMDKRVSDHIMALHAGYGENLSAPKKQCIEKYAALQNDEHVELGVRSGSLASKLKLDPDKDKDFVPLPGPLLRKYIAYARNFVFPRMSRPAAEMLGAHISAISYHAKSLKKGPCFMTWTSIQTKVRLQLVIKVGAATETELGDRKLRIEDAKNAIFIVIEEAIGSWNKFDLI